MKKAKILFISHTNRTAGAEKCLLTLVRYLDKERFEPVVVLPAEGALGEELRRVGARTIVSPLEWWGRVPRTYGLFGSDIDQRVKALVRIIEEEAPAVVHTNTSVIWEGALAAALTGIPHVWHLHEKLAEHPSIRTLFPLPVVYSLIDELSDRVVAVSDAVRAEIAGPIAAAKVSVIRNGVSYSVSDPADAKALRSELGVAEDTAIAVSVGALIPEKGYGTLLAAAALTRQKLKVAFVIVGGGEPDAVRALMDQVHQLGLDGSVHYLGYRADVPRIIAGADLFVLSSESEAFSLVILEAMAAAKPVVATDCGGPRELIVDGETGVLVPVGDSSALANGIMTLVADNSLAAGMGERGRVRFTACFTAERYAQKFGELYSEIASAAPRSVGSERRIFLAGMMRTYQLLAEKAMAAGIRHELVKLVKRGAAIPLRPLQWAIERKKRHRR